MNADVCCSAEHAERNKSSILALPSNMRHVLERNDPLDEVRPDTSLSAATAKQPDPSITDIPSGLEKTLLNLTLPSPISHLA